MKLPEWQNSNRRVAQARRLLDQPFGKTMLEILEEHRPEKWFSPQLRIGAPAHDHSRMLGWTEGYNYALEIIRSMAKAPFKAPAPLTATFEEPEPNQ